MSASSIPFTSSPLTDAGLSSSPKSTLDTGGGTEGLLAGASEIISSVGNVVLGGLAISRLPTGQPNVTTAIQAKASGVEVTSSPTGLLPGITGGATFNITSVIILLLILIGGWYAVKHL